MQLELDMPILGEDDNASETYGPHEEDKSKKKDIKGVHRNLVGKS